MYWKYFKDGLKWLFVAAPGPIAAIVQGAAWCLDLTRENILWLRKQFNPETCDIIFLRKHAKSRGIIRNKSEIDDDRFKARVVNAYAWQLLGGKNAGLPVIFQHYGYSNIDITNIRTEDPLRWAEFRLSLEPPPGEGFNINDWELIPFIANDQKPARSKVESIKMVLSVSSDTPHLVPVACYGEEITVYPYTTTYVENSGQTPQIVFGYQAVETITVQPE